MSTLKSFNTPWISHRPLLLPYFSLLIGVICLGFSGIFVKWANAPGVVSAFYRMGIATLILFIPFMRTWSQQTKIATQHLICVIFAGLFFSFDLTAYNIAVLMNNATTATLFGNAAPIFVGLGALLIFKEKLNRWFWVGLFIALVGALLILTHDFQIHLSYLKGDLVALVSAFFYACFMLVMQRARNGMNSLVAWWISAFVSSLSLLALCLIFSKPLLGYSAATYWNFLGLALITQIGGYLSVTYALGYIPASIASPALLGQPLMTAILAMPLLGEILSPLQLVGGVLVLFGIGLIIKVRSKT